MAVGLEATDVSAAAGSRAGVEQAGKTAGAEATSRAVGKPEEEKRRGNRATRPFWQGMRDKERPAAGSGKRGPAVRPGKPMQKAKCGGVG